MPFQPVEDGIQVLVNYRELGQELQSQLYFQTDEPATEGRLTDVAQMVADWLTNSWTGVACNFATVVSILATDVSVSGGAQVTFTPIGGIVGALSSPPLPTGTTVTASWRTGRSGRSFRGRTYHVGLTETQVDGNALTAPSQSALQQAYTDLIIAANVIDAPLSVCSRVSNGVLRNPAILTPVLSCLVDQYIDSQRRRLTGRGR